MDKVRIHDKSFREFISANRIEIRTKELAEKLEEQLKGKDILFLAILNGSFMFAAELLKRFNLPCSISFLKLSSYRGTESTGTITELIGLTEDIRGKTVVVIEDIVDTGKTLGRIISDLEKGGAESIRVVTLLMKPGAFTGKVNPDWVGFEIPNDFVVGYGLDYDGQGRNLNGLYLLD